MSAGDPHQTELWLIRHAESTGNRDGVLQGQEDLPLSPLGLRQADLAVKRLLTAHQKSPFAACYSSDLQRTRQTAEPLAAACGLEVIPDRRLREIDVGRWSGLTTSEIQVRFPDEWAAWQERSPTLRRGGGESYQDACNRMTPILLQIADNHPGGRILVVTHGGVIRAYLGGLLGLDLTNIWHLSVSNTAISRVRPFEIAIGGRRPRRGRIICINDVGHLDG